MEAGTEPRVVKRSAADVFVRLCRDYLYDGVERDPEKLRKVLRWGHEGVPLAWLSLVLHQMHAGLLV